MKETDEIIAILSDEQSREIIKLLTKTELSIQQVTNLLNILNQLHIERYED